MNCQPLQRRAVRRAADAIDELGRTRSTHVVEPSAGPTDRWALVARFDPQMLGLPSPVCSALATNGLRVRTWRRGVLVATP